MNKCKCGSYAINESCHGREPGVDLELCDVCYWRSRAEAAKAASVTTTERVEESMDWVHDHLCWHDPRYPQYIKPYDDDPVVPPRTNCSCDNCFTGKDKLAIALLVKAATLSVVKKLHDVAVKERDWERHKLNEAMKFASAPDGVAISMHSNFVLLELSCRDTLSDSEQSKAVANIFRWVSDLVANCHNRWNVADGNQYIHTVR